MKNYLLLSLAAFSLMGCQKANLNPEVIPVDKNAPIALSSGAMSTRAGVLSDITGFAAADEIGVISVMSLKETSSGSEDDEPNWAKLQFENQKAVAKAPVGEAADPKTNEFTWATQQFYPQGKNIFLYAYYPYFKDAATSAASGVKYIAGVTTPEPATAPKLEVSVLGETITDEVASGEGALDPKKLKQQDVMIGHHTTNDIGATTPVSINRESAAQNTALVFNHLLTQLQFTIQKEKNVSGEPLFKSLKLTTPKTAVYTFGSADYTTPTLQFSTPAAATDSVVYTITHTTPTIQFPEKAAGGATSTAVPILNPDDDYSPLMVLPLTVAQLQGCLLELTVNFSSGGYGDHTFKIDMTKLTAAWQAGKIVTLNFTLNYVGITLSATIKPWEEDTNKPELPLE